jgi:hypothetical protein
MLKLPGMHLYLFFVHPITSSANFQDYILTTIQANVLSHIFHAFWRPLIYVVLYQPSPASLDLNSSLIQITMKIHACLIISFLLNA